MRSTYTETHTRTPKVKGYDFRFKKFSTLIQNLKTLKDNRYHEVYYRTQIDV